MRLPGTQNWLKPDVDAQVAFEVGFADDNEYLMRLFAQGLGEQSSINPTRLEQSSIVQTNLFDTEAIFARGRAAELAFATEDIQLGLSICRDLLQKDHPQTPMQTAYYAALGAAVGALGVKFDPNGVFIYSPFLPNGFRMAWPFEDSAFVVILMRLLLPAVAASGGVIEAARNLETMFEAVGPQALAALTATLELRALITQPESALGFSQLAAVLTMEDNYAAHIGLMRSDPYHWNSLQPKGPLIDWRLLCTWIAFLRFNAPLADLKWPPHNPEAGFIRWLAQTLKPRPQDLTRQPEFAR